MGSQVPQVNFLGAFFSACSGTFILRHLGAEGSGLKPAGTNAGRDKISRGVSCFLLKR